jgi:hypothetical protein
MAKPRASGASLVRTQASQYMTLRADHIAGLCFVGIGVLVIALSRDLPFGTLSSPGAGFLPFLLAIITMILGVALMMRASESRAVSLAIWPDLAHAAMVVGAIVVATALYLQLGFFITSSLLMIALLVIVERRRVLPAVIYSLSAVSVTYLTFEYVLNTPLAIGPYGF